MAVVLVSGCASWRGISGVPLPGGPGSGEGHLTVYVQMADTLAINVNSRVRVADVYVGRVRTVELRNWIATLTVDLEPTVQLPANAVAAIGQTTLLGSQHLELTEPPDPSPVPLTDGDTIPLTRTSAFPTTERTLAAITSVLTGGGLPNLEAIQTEVHDILTGRAETIREFLMRLRDLTDGLDRQRADIGRAIDSTGELLDIVADRVGIIDRTLQAVPPLIEHLAASRDRIVEALIALGRIGRSVESMLGPAATPIATNLAHLQSPLGELARSAPYLLGALRMMMTAPFPCCDAIPKAVRGDYVNASITIDLTLSALDNGFLSGTGLAGSLRAIEQAWGRNPDTMIPDVRYTPNPLNAPGGPLIERGE